MPVRLFTSSLALALLPAMAMADPPKAPSAKTMSTKKQLVIISFDGAHDNRLWDKSLDTASRTGAHFTYFLSCTFLMTKAGLMNKAGDGKAYQAPGHNPGRSNVGFAQSQDEIAIRVRHIWQAHKAGHDIGSHACGHFDGKDWTSADWTREFSSFRHALDNAWVAGGIGAEQPPEWRDFAAHGITGFRAPYLSVSPGLLPAVKQAGFTYDASLVTKGPALPQTDDGIPRFGLPTIPEGPSQRRVIGMDYNLFVRHSMGVENRKDSATFEARALEAYRKAFKAQYDGDRVPLQLGFHFVEMNGGAYWRALDTFLTETCRQPDVACVSYAGALAMGVGAKGTARDNGAMTLQ